VNDRKGSCSAQTRVNKVPLYQIALHSDFFDIVKLVKVRVLVFNNQSMFNAVNLVLVNNCDIRQSFLKDIEGQDIAIDCEGYNLIATLLHTELTNFLIAFRFVCHTGSSVC